MSQVRPPQDRGGFHVAIICALPLEATCVQAVFDRFWENDTKSYGKVPGDPNAYTTGVIGDHNVVLAHLPGMGKVSASQVAASLHISFPAIELVAVVGICGAVPRIHDTGKDIFLGDVVIGEALVQYDFGKQYPQRFETTSSTKGDLYRLSGETRAVLAKLKTYQHGQRMEGSILEITNKILEKLPDVEHPVSDTDKVHKPSYVHKHRWFVPGQECAECYESENAICLDAPKMTCDTLGCNANMLARTRSQAPRASLIAVHIGKIGSGDTVMKSGQDRDRMAKELGVIAFEMEGAGVGVQVPSIVIKGVCDYADSHKHKIWQGYAASTAAACFKAFLQHWSPKQSSEPAEKSTFKLPSWLTPPDPTLNYRRALELREPGTGSWFLETSQYKDWKCSKKSSLWMYGIPGCGKTVLSAVVVEDITQYCQEKTEVVAYFYFDFKDPQKQGVDSMLKSLILQIVQNRDSLSLNLESAFPADVMRTPQPSTDVLMDCLKSLADGVAKVFLVVDALDESIDPVDVSNVLGRIADWNSVQLLLSSRRDRDIEIILEQFVEEDGRICLQTDLLDEDIRCYVRARIATDRKLAKWRKASELCQEIEAVLTSKAGGMFRWAACQLDALSRCLTRSQVRSALNSLPKTLDQTYDRILSSVDEDFYTVVLRILQWLAFSARPLMLDEVARIAAIDLDRDPVFDLEDVLEDPLDVLTICSSLVTITVINALSKKNSAAGEHMDDRHASATAKHSTDTESEETEYRSSRRDASLGQLRSGGAESGQLKHPGTAVILAHYSVREYLLSERMRQGTLSRYSIRAEESNELIARSCLACLSQTLEQDQFSSNNTLGTWKLLDYSASYWERHARLAGPDNEAMIHSVVEFMSPGNCAFSNWIHHYSPDIRSLPSTARRFMVAVSYRNRKMPGPLYFASLTGLLGVVQHLLATRVADCDEDRGYLGTPLQAAASGGFAETVQALLEGGADVRMTGGFYGCALLAAVTKGHESVVNMLLSAGADVDAQLDKSYTALHVAISHGNFTLVQKLLDSGASLSIRNGDGQTAIEYASIFGRHAITRTLMEHQVSQGPTNGTTKLHSAAWLGLVDVLEELIQAGWDVDILDDNNTTPLHYAAENFQEPAALFLLDAGADPNIASENWGTALHIACHTGLHKAVQVMLEIGVDINQPRDGGDWTPLHLAATKAHKDIIQLLIEHGADPTPENLNNMTALDIAHALGHDEIIDMLQEAHRQFTRKRSMFGIGGTREVASKESMQRWVSSLDRPLDTAQQWLLPFLLTPSKKHGE